MAAPLSAQSFLKALKDEGLKVIEVGSWKTHNRNHKGAWGPVNGVMIHHTVTKGTSATVKICRDGHADLPGPLCHGVIAKDGTVHLVGYGRANHAGLGDDDVLAAVQNEKALPADNEANTDGNARFYGFECENLGDGKDPWPAVQLEAIEKAAAALCRAHGWNAASVIGHLEWQPGKIDPKGFTMASMRSRIADRLKGTPSSPSTPPATSTSIVPKSRESAATVLKQQTAALKAWPFIPTVEKTHGLPANLLIAVGSRETNCTNKVGDGGHGHGVWQRDDRWWPIPDGYDQDVRQQAEDAATLLAANYKALGEWGPAIAAYNAGLTGVKDAMKAGKSPDSVTTGKDYAADVLGRLAHLKATETSSGGGTAGATKYTVKKGDTLTGIAKKHNTTVAKLVSLNGLKDADQIAVGQVLKLTATAAATYVPFPGANFFHGGRHSDVITAMGRRLVAEGCGKYSQGPGPNWTNADTASYAAWQRKLGYTGSAADGIPGKASWEKLRVPKP